MKDFNEVWIHLLKINKQKTVKQPILIRMLLPLIETREHGNFLAEFQQKYSHNWYVELKKLLL